MVSERVLIHEVGEGMDSRSFRKLKGELRGWDDELGEKEEEDVVEVAEAKSLGGGETINGVVDESCCCCCCCC